MKQIILEVDCKWQLQMVFNYLMGIITFKVWIFKIQNVIMEEIFVYNIIKVQLMIKIEM